MAVPRADWTLAVECDISVPLGLHIELNGRVQECECFPRELPDGGKGGRDISGFSARVSLKCLTL